MKTVCIYHSVDLDGWMSAAIVKHWFNQQEVPNKEGEDCNTIDFIGYNYGQPIPDLSEYDSVIMCDISFPKEELLKLNTPTDRLTWIDHHASALREFYDSFNTIEATNKFFKGLRSSKFAACELTWKYFFPNEPMPEIIRLLGRYDCFGHKGTDEEQKVLEFQYGARGVISNYEEAYNHLNVDIYSDYDVVNVLLKEGKAIYKYLCTEAKQIYKDGFSIILKLILKDKEHIDYVPYKFICFNKAGFNPVNFGINYHADGYDGVASFNRRSDGTWTFNLRNDNGKVDCSIIAKQFGGGGHKGAAGFIIKDLKTLHEII
jgi:oligoribonuclease NrnB/cAMP/cGMP phosphodiesterase (DHH superfamily)